MTKKFQILDELGEVVHQADERGTPDAEIIRTLVFVSIEECFRRAQNNESAILVLICALYTKLADAMGLGIMGFNDQPTEKGRH